MMPIPVRIYCIAMRKDNFKHKGNAKSICSPSPPPQSVTSVPSAPYAAVNSRKQLSCSCVYTDPVAMLPALLADCHAVAFSQYAVLHSVACKHFSLQNESSVWVTVFFFCTRIDPVLTSAAVHLQSLCPRIDIFRCSLLGH